MLCRRRDWWKVLLLLRLLLFRGGGGGRGMKVDRDVVLVLVARWIVVVVVGLDERKMVREGVRSELALTLIWVLVLFSTMKVKMDMEKEGKEGGKG